MDDDVATIRRDGHLTHCTVLEQPPFGDRVVVDHCGVRRVFKRSQRWVDLDGFELLAPHTTTVGTDATRREGQ